MAERRVRARLVVVALVAACSVWAGPIPTVHAAGPAAVITTIHTGLTPAGPTYLRRNGNRVDVTSQGQGGIGFNVGAGTVSGGFGGWFCNETPPNPDRLWCNPMGLAIGPMGETASAYAGNSIIEVRYPTFTAQYGQYNVSGFGGDGGPATAALFTEPEGVTFDRFGNLYVIDQSRIRKIDVNGIITTFAGTGQSGFSGDGGPATAARMRGRAALGRHIVADWDGNIYFGDRLNGRIRKVDTNGIITTVAGIGGHAEAPDGSVAATSPIFGVTGLAVMPTGELLFGESETNKIKMIDSAGLVQTVAGTGVEGYNGDGPATSTMLDTPSGMTWDVDGTLLIGDNGNRRVRRLTFATGSVTGTVTAPGGGPAAGVTVTVLRDWPSWQTIGTTVTAADGTYTVTGLTTGRHRVRFFDPQGRWQRQWWQQRGTYSTGDTAIVPAGASVTVNDTLTTAGVNLIGRVTDQSSSGPIPGARVQVFNTDGYVASAAAGPDGYYHLNALPPGNYKIRFLDPVPGAHRSAWHDGAPTYTASTPITLTTGTTTINAALTTWS